MFLNNQLKSISQTAAQGGKTLVPFNLYVSEFCPPACKSVVATEMAILVAVKPKMCFQELWAGSQEPGVLARVALPGHTGILIPLLVK